MNEKIIRLTRATDADDLSCADGEVIDADFLFPDTSEPGSEDLPEVNPSAHLGVSPVLELPPGAVWLTLHLTDESPQPRAVVYLPERRLAYNSEDLPGIEELSARAAGQPSHWLFIGPELPDVKKAVTVGPWLCILTASALMYARWNGKTYDWLGEAPGPSSATVAIRPKALPPYSSIDGTLPRFSVSAPAGDDEAINKALQAKKKEFLADVEKAGLLFDPVMAATCLVAEQGSCHEPVLFGMSKPRQAGYAEPVTLRTVASQQEGGTVYLTVEVSHPPFVIEEPDADKSELGAWADVITGVRVLVGKSEADLPACHRTMDCCRPDNLYSIGNRLFATGCCLDFSLAGLPFISQSTGKETPPLPCSPIYLTGSLASSSSGLPVLYAFCDDGIHSLSPAKEGGDYVYRDSRLISRHVALGPDSFAPLPDGTAFISQAGVMKLSGIAVKAISRNTSLTASDRLVYLYGADTVIVTRLDRHYAWPSAWIRIGSMIGDAVLSGDTPGYSASYIAERTDGEDGEIGETRLETRPVKLGAPFAIKQLHEVRALWPDGNRLPVTVYGALRLDRWHYLGTAPKGHMQTRGSGWRFFRFVTYASGRALPLLRVRYSTAT